MIEERWEDRCGWVGIVVCEGEGVGGMVIVE